MLLTPYTYPVSFTIGGGSESCMCTALILSTNTCICVARATAGGGICGGNSTQAPILCSCGGEHSKMTVCSSGNAQIPSCSSSSTQITVSPV